MDLLRPRPTLRLGLDMQPKLAKQEVLVYKFIYCVEVCMHMHFYLNYLNVYI